MLCPEHLGECPQVTDIFFFLEVLELELRAFALSHSNSPVFVKGVKGFSR
jgi:hypothetical protein